MRGSQIHSLMQQAGGKVSTAIQSASSKTGVDFGYLMKQASVESSFNPSAKARTSSATGLYQFIDSTWLDMVRKYGDQYGLGQYSSQISENGTVSNSKARQSILALRKDPEISAYMAAEFAAENRQYLSQELNRTEQSFGATDLYLAHFMGAGGAAQFLEANQKTPYATAADIMPQAARANPSIFYQNGRALTVAEVYQNFDRKFDGVETGTAQAPQTMVADSSYTYRRDNNEDGVDRYNRFYTRSGSRVDTTSTYGDMEMRAAMRATRSIPATSAGRYLMNPVAVAEMAQPEASWASFARGTSEAATSPRLRESTRYNS
jgi:hypothetical protein